MRRGPGSTLLRGDRWIFAGLLALLVWLPLPWGSNLPSAKAFLAFCASTLLGLWLSWAALGRIQAGFRLRQLLAPALWWIAWLGWIGASLWPLAGGTLQELSPEASRLYAEARHAGVAVVPRLSIAPSLTFDALLLSAGYASLYFLVLVTCRQRPERARWVLLALVVSGLVQALYGALMVLTGLEWGFLEAKLNYRGVATGTFVNRNHLAGYLELCAAAALGLILSDLSSRAMARSWRQRLLDFIALVLSRKVRVRMALVVMAVALVMTRSRTGNVAFVAALCICGLGYMLLRHRDRMFGAFVLFSSVVIIDLLIVSRWYGLERLVSRLEATDLQADGRAALLDALPPVVDHYWHTGSGLGSFAQAFAPFRPAEMRDFFLHAHNDYLQFLIETGAIGVALLGIFVLVHVLHALRILLNRRSRLPAAVAFATLMATLALALHSLTDFNLQIPANAATLLCLMALGAATSGKSRQRRVTESESAYGGAREDGLDSDPPPIDGRGVP